MFELKENAEKVEKALLIGIQRTNDSFEEISEHLDELAQLVENIDVEVLKAINVRLRHPAPRLFIGKGKAEDIAQTCHELGADVIVFDDDLTPTQQRNWETLTNVCVIDRTEVILDIFSQRAQTQEARLQVQLARAKYSLPRLTRAWAHLGRQGGGTGTGQRGEGEQQIELDRRQISRRIAHLEKQLKEVRKHRSTQRKLRRKKPVPVATLVGYTNAGKSSVLNHLTESKVYEADKLFATLDPTTKSITLPNNQEMLLTDTVGFIRKLPHMLVESFKATLEEAVVSDFLLHIIDINTPNLDDHLETTTSVLKEIGAQQKDIILVFNKTDIFEAELDLMRLKKKHPNAFFVSCRTGEGMEELRGEIANFLNDHLEIVHLQIPLSRADIISLVHRSSDIKKEKYKDDHVAMTAAVSKALRTKIRDWERQKKVDN
ncbi:GTPase HflX [bacterium B17]|nr:GTPase HflX [bacterium B17]